MQRNINEELRAPKEESRRHLKCITLSIRAQINLVRSLLLIDGPIYVWKNINFFSIIAMASTSAGRLIICMMV